MLDEMLSDYHVNLERREEPKITTRYASHSIVG